MARESIVSARPPGYGHPDRQRQSPQPGAAPPSLRRGPQRASVACPKAPVGALAQSLACSDRRQTVKELMLADKAEACKSLSVEQLAERYSERLGRGISPAILEKIYKPSVAIKNLSVADLPAWVETTNSLRILKWLAAELGYELAGPDEQRMAELGRLTREISERQQRVRELLKGRAA